MTGRSTALLIVDMQEYFRTDASSELELRIADWVRRHRDRYRSIVATRFLNEAGSLYARTFGAGCEPHDPGSRPMARIEALGLSVASGCTYSSVLDDVRAGFERGGIERVHVCGIDTDQCVLATCFALWDAQLEPVLLADLCVSGAGLEFHRAALLLACRSFGEGHVLDSDIVWNAEDYSRV